MHSNPWDISDDLQNCHGIWVTKGTVVQYKVATLDRRYLPKGSAQEREFYHVEKLGNPQLSMFSFSSSDHRRAKISKVEVIWNEKLEQRYNTYHVFN